MVAFWHLKELLMYLLDKKKTLREIIEHSELAAYTSPCWPVSYVFRRTGPVGRRWDFLVWILWKYSLLLLVFYNLTSPDFNKRLMGMSNGGARGKVKDGQSDSNSSSINICGHPSSSCWDILVWDKVLDHQLPILTPSEQHISLWLCRYWQWYSLYLTWCIWFWKLMLSQYTTAIIVEINVLGKQCWEQHQ